MLVNPELLRVLAAQVDTASAAIRSADDGLRTQSGDWAHVQDIADQVPGRQAPTPGATVFVMSDGSAPSIAAGAMTPDGSAMRDVVRFYWEQPDSRAELTDGRAVKRLAEERFEA